MEVGIGLGAHARPAQASAASVPPALPDDTDTASALARGEAGALELVYRRHSRGVYSLAVHLLGDPAAAEEVVQETFLKLWRQPHAYQPARGRLLPWLLGVAHHHAVDLLRRRRLEQRHRAPVAAEPEHTPLALEELIPAADDLDPAVGAGHAEQRRLVTSALTALPEEQRLPLLLAYYRGLTQAEIAALLGQPLGTIKTRMRLALQRLRSAPGLSEVWNDR